MSYIPDLIKICSELKSGFFTDEPLKNHVSFKIGGNCRMLISVNSVKCIQDITRFCRDEKIKYAVIGKGSNILVPDSGFDGIILLFGKDFSDIKVTGENTIFCQSGASLKSLCCTALENSLSGSEFAYGIPGTVGGAVFMNAGAYGGEMKDIITSAEYIDSSGELKTIQAADMELSYRHSFFSDRNCIITGASFRLASGNYNDIKNRMNELISKRREKQPLEYPSAGSTFKRPEGAYAAALIEQCGLKGMSIGDAEVSTKHSGFIINKGNATFNDVMQLIETVQKTVKEKTGYILEMEPEIIK